MALRGVSLPRWFRPGREREAPGRCTRHWGAPFEYLRGISGERVEEGPSGRPITCHRYMCRDCAVVNLEYWVESGTGLIYEGRWHE